MTSRKVSIKSVKDYWDQRPCNIRHSNAKIGTVKYFNEVEKRKYFVEPHILKFAEFSRWKNKNVLEIGCGIGTDTINFAREGASVTAVELSKKSLNLAKKRATIFGLNKRIKFYYANAEDLSKSVPLKKYDLIYSFGVIHHTPNAQEVVYELKKYCKRETTVKIMVYHKFSWKTLWILFKFGKGKFWKLNSLISQHSEAAFGSPITYLYSKKEIMRLLKGFRITNIVVDHIFPYKISDYVQYKYKKVWYFRCLPKSLFRILETHFGWHLLITAKPTHIH